MSQILISHAPEDGEVAAYLAGDLERQGVRAVAQPGNEQLLYTAPALVVLIGPGAAASPVLRADAERAAAAGKLIYAVRLAEVAGDPLQGLPVRGWTDAYGPQAQANVARLAGDLRLAGGGAAPGYGGYPPPPQPYGRPAGGSSTKWIAIAGGAVGAIVLVVAVLEITETINLFDSGSSSSYSSSTYSPPSYSSSSGNLSMNSSMANSYAPSSSSSSVGGVTREWLTGTWGPGCPGSSVGAFQLNASGSVYSGSNYAGSWSLSGNRLTTVDRGMSETSTWIRLGPNSASVSVPNIGTRTISRCGTYTGM